MTYKVNIIITIEVFEPIFKHERQFRLIFSKQ